MGNAISRNGWILQGDRSCKTESESHIERKKRKTLAMHFLTDSILTEFWEKKMDYGVSPSRISTDRKFN